MANRFSPEVRQIINDAWNRLLASVGVRASNFILADTINEIDDRQDSAEGRLDSAEGRLTTIESGGTFLPLTGGTMSGTIDMDANEIHTVKKVTLDPDSHVFVQQDAIASEGSPAQGVGILAGVGGAAGDLLPGGMGGGMDVAGGDGGAASATNAAGVGGAASLSGGFGGDGTGAQAAGVGGAVYVWGGNGGTVHSGGPGANGGAVNVIGGDATGVGTHGGDVNIDTGAGPTGGTIYIGRAEAAAVEIGSVALPIDIPGGLVISNGGITFPDTTVQTTAAVSGVSGGWILAKTGNFMTDTPQVIGVDGSSYTICGVAGSQKVNSAADASAAAIVAGEGLVITPIASSEYEGASRSSPIIRIPLSAMVPADKLSFTTPLRFTAIVNTANSSASYDFAAVAFEGPAFVDNTTKMLKTGNTSASFMGRWTAGYNHKVDINDGTWGAYKAARITFPNGIASRFAIYEMYNSTGGSYPADADWKIGGRYTVGADNNATDIRSLGSLSGWTVAFTAGRAGSGNALVVKFAGFKLEYKA